MRQLLGVAVILALAGCGATQEASLTATCTNVMQDPDVQRDIRRADISIEEYCGCATARLLSLPDSERDEMVTTFETMENLMQAHNGSAEDAFRELSNASRADDATPEAVAAYQSMDKLGQHLDDLLDEMEDADKACPV